MNYDNEGFFYDQGVVEDGKLSYIPIVVQVSELFSGKELRVT